MRINVALRDPGGGATGGNDDAQDAPADDVTDAVDEHPTEPDAVTGIDPLQSRLWAQVRKGEPAMTTDADGRLRHRNWPDSHGILFLGDVCEALLRCFGAYEPPQVSEQPRLDQQRWTIVITDGVLEVTVRSRSYWGWGLFNRCFLNEMVLTGPLERRSRLMFDLTAALGRNPWEASMGIFWRKATGAGEDEHRGAWQELIAHANEHMNEEIHTHAHRLENLHASMEEYEQGNHPGWERGEAEEILRRAGEHLDTARGALHDRNAAGLERALGRCEAAMVEADPTTEVRRSIFQEAEDLLLPDTVEVNEEDLRDQVLEHEELPDEVERITPDEVSVGTSDVQADDLLTGVDDEPVDEVPLVDLTESE
jgi:hypothetical protein